MLGAGGPLRTNIISSPKYVKHNYYKNDSLDDTKSALKLGLVHFMTTIVGIKSNLEFFEISDKADPIFGNDFIQKWKENPIGIYDFKWKIRIVHTDRPSNEIQKIAA